VLKDLGISDCDVQLLGRLLDRHRLQEPQLEYPAISLGQRGEHAPRSLGGLARLGGLVEAPQLGIRIDRGDLDAQPASPVAGQDRPRGGQKVGSHLAPRRRHAQRSQSGDEHLGGQILSVGTVTDLRVHEPLDTSDVVNIVRVPVGVDVISYHPQPRQVTPSRLIADVRRAAVIRIIIYHRPGLPHLVPTQQIGGVVTPG
jgi:hypothetical protein